MSGKSKARIIAVIVVAIALIAAVGSTLAWFLTNSSLSQTFNISGFTAGADVYFLSNGEKVPASGYTDGEGVYLLSLDEKSVNYIGNLRVDATMSGAKACMRIRINHEWTNADGSVSQYTTAVPYKISTGWYDNRSNDYCIYYKGSDFSGKTDFEKSSVITDFDKNMFDTMGFDAGTSVRVSIEVDAVQPNRYPQLWNMEKLPWN